MTRRLTSAAAVASILLAATALAAEPDQGPAPRTFQTWPVPPGLVGASVRAITQTADGKIWVATRAGVAHLEDGGFAPLSVVAGFERARDIVAFAEDAKGTLWMAPTEGEPVCYREQRLNDCLIDAQRMNRTVRIVDMTTDPGGAVWLGATDLIYSFSAGSLSWTGSFPEERVGAVRAIHLDGKGRLWVGGERGLFLRRGDGDITAHAVPGSEPLGEALAITGGREGAVWVAGAGFLLRTGGDDDQLARRADGLPEARFASIVEDRRGTVWAASDRGLLRWQPSSAAPFRLFTRADGLPDDRLTTILQDRQGVFWLGTQEAGLVRFEVVVPATDAPARPRRLTTPLLSGLALVGLAAVAALLWWRRRSRATRASGAGPGASAAPR